MSKWNVRGVLWFSGGVLFVVVLLFGGGWVYLAKGRLPVAVADRGLPFEQQLVDIPLDARIDREKQNPPFVLDQSVYEAGASLYQQHCASCHGTPGKDAEYAKWMYPEAPQLWKKHRSSDVVGVSDDEPGETFWKIKNGIRLTGMPAYSHLLSDEQMWDISLLLKKADQPLPDSVKALLFKQ